MFNPAQISKWRGLLAGHELNGVTFDGYSTGSAKLNLDNPPLSPSEDGTRTGDFYPPERIFGDPIEPKCLDGIGRWPVKVKSPRFGCLPNARVIGFNAILDQTSRLYSPEAISSENATVFLRANSRNHQGFIAYEDKDQHIIVQYGCRSQPRTLDCNAVFFHNPEPGNYGSFMFRQFPQMAGFVGFDGHIDCYITPERTPWFMEAMALLRLPKRPVFTVREVCGELFRSIIICNDIDAEGFVSPDFLSGTRALAKTIFRKENRNLNPKIYVSRALSQIWRPWYRPMLNESEIEKKVVEKGFRIVYPETLTLTQQIEEFASAQYVLGPSGSGMFNVLFSIEPPRVLDIETFSVAVRQHAKFYASCGCSYAFLFVTPEEGGRPVAHRTWQLPETFFGSAVDWLLSRN